MVKYTCHTHSKHLLLNIIRSGFFQRGSTIQRITRYNLGNHTHDQIPSCSSLQYKVVHTCRTHIKHLLLNKIRSGFFQQDSTIQRISSYNFGKHTHHQISSFFGLQYKVVHTCRTHSKHLLLNIFCLVFYW